MEGFGAPQKLGASPGWGGDPSIRVMHSGAGFILGPLLMETPIDNYNCINISDDDLDLGCLLELACS